MIVITGTVVYGPYTKVDVSADCLTCDGAELPLSVIGQYQVLNAKLPDGYSADECLWNGTAVVVAPSGSEEPDGPN
jgi:hypothetical protein